MYQEHEYYLKRCIEISKHSRETGNTPFGAILVDAEGNILLEQENVEISSKKCTGHAETQLVERADPGNRRQVKANDSYYLLKKTGVPIVIVECGFLSNREEAARLCTPEYQERVAWAIHMGILEYLNENEK